MSISSVSTHNLFPEALESGAAERSSIAKPLVDIKDILPILNSVGRDGQAQAEAMSGPQLRSPSTAASKQVTDGLKSYLSEKAQDPFFAQDLSMVYQKVESGVSKQLDNKLKEQAEQGKPFDISGMAPNSVALMVGAIVLMSALRTADNTLSNKLSQVGFDATKATAASMVREGVANLSSSTVQGVGQMALTGVGTKKSLSGLNAERGALKNNAPKLVKAGDEGRKIQTTLGSQNTVKLGTEPDSLKQVGLKPQQSGVARPGEQNMQSNATDSVMDGMAGDKAGLTSSNPTLSQPQKSGVAKPGEQSMQSQATDGIVEGMAGDKVGLTSSNPTLSKSHQTALSRAGEDLPVKSQIEQLTMEDTKLKAQAKQTTGKAIMDSSFAVGNIAGGTGRYVATLEQSEQQISQASSRVANTASEETRESSGKSDKIIQDLLRALDTISQSKSATMSAVAGNIRA